MRHAHKNHKQLKFNCVDLELFLLSWSAPPIFGGLVNSHGKHINYKVIIELSV